VLLAAILQCLNVDSVLSLQSSLPFATNRFSASKPAESLKRSPFSAFYAENQNQAQSSTGLESPQDASVNGSSGGLMNIGDSLKSQLASAFSNLDESDQYDAVLTGLCAKILDQPSTSGNQAAVALQDPIQLVEEMNGRRIPASPRSLMALIDVRVTNLLEATSE
jgi:hypothetical protein